MKNFIFRICAIVALCLVASLIAASAEHGKQDFTLHNETGVEIHSLYVSPHDSDDWQDDILGQETLPNGESVKVTFDNREKQAKWDLKVTDKNGNALEWENLDLTKITNVTIHWDAKQKKGWADVK